MKPDLRSLADSELLDWLRLLRSDSVGPRTFRALLVRFGTAALALEALPRLRAGQAFVPATRAAAEAEFKAAGKAGVRFVPVCDPAYPASLRAIADAPPLLALRGPAAILQRSMVAIVGSRNASTNGLIFTDRLAQGIGDAGHVVVSGLARGIDARAHQASLATGTVAVLAGGHNRIYPRDHRDLLERIAETGAVLSEMPFDWEPRGRDFPRRNRIVSGLSLGVVVVEAARRSGSLITARFGNEQGREVFAVPGHPFDPRAEGTNDLIRAGATVCTSAEDVTSALRPMLPHGPARDLRDDLGTAAPAQLFWDEIELDTPAPATAPVARQSGVGVTDPRLEADEPPASALDRVTALIGTAPVSIDDLVRTSDLPAQVVRALIVEMELDGTVVRQGANGVALVGQRAPSPARDSR